MQLLKHQMPHVDFCKAIVDRSTANGPTGHRPDMLANHKRSVVCLCYAQCQLLRKVCPLRARRSAFPTICCISEAEAQRVSSMLFCKPVWPRLGSKQVWSCCGRNIARKGAPDSSESFQMFAKTVVVLLCQTLPLRPNLFSLGAGFSRVGVLLHGLFECTRCTIFNHRFVYQGRRFEGDASDVIWAFVAPRSFPTIVQHHEMYARRRHYVVATAFVHNNGQVPVRMFAHYCSSLPGQFAISLVRCKEQSMRISSTMLWTMMLSVAPDAHIVPARGLVSQRCGVLSSRGCVMFGQAS